MRQNTLLVALSALTVATAQTNFTIEPSTVNPSLRSEWCGAEYNSCNKLCGSRPIANDCNVNTLAYNCTCSNGTAPGLQYYIQTIPTYICERTYSDCIAANTNSQKGQDDCKANILSQCGKLDPNDVEVGSSDETASTSTSTSGPAPTEAPTDSGAQNEPSTTTSTGGAAAATKFAYLGNGAALAAAGVFAALL